ncbi:hypothetical protein NRB_04790 [Novosphingobium sp. 11B]
MRGGKSLIRGHDADNGVGAGYGSDGIPAPAHAVARVIGSLRVSLLRVVGLAIVSTYGDEALHRPSFAQCLRRFSEADEC